MRAFYTDIFVLPLPQGHRFPMAKYSLLRQRLLETGVIAPEHLRVPHAATDAELLRAHDPAYVQRVQKGELTAQEIRRIGFPWTPAMVERSRRSSGATVEACYAALEDGVAVNLAGGTHHAFRDRGGGYCVFNDAAIAARTLQAEGLARRVVIIDCDVHQGDGTAAILHDDPSIFTFSIHGQNNYPFQKQQSDLDIGLPDGTTDEAYLAALDYGLRESLRRANADFAIYLAGADPYEGDSLGKLKVSLAGLARRDHMVLSACRQAGLPVAIAMAGGYAKRVEETVAVHYQTVSIAAQYSRA
ncbi:MAG: histone deacetylase [Candidatus Thermofonsia Clade 1 bacterium]|jgi:acetoin utilization deacetylase AcuC-like enzyme|uniref:Histone deacetylase n=1 Tax=Candidatus Thermofonsia Clade 1 bacterium TaxID=2364210 RepID=A0A2M8Q033_9CHLR|nr:MAG: histone deacetylase [Candidatus Thermofonsia Clade 1 bacterium]PJF43161.1 MAG: histone deacetylase [Candidatus Thermofonsia Clade 1 bacterium]RMF52317.1 MAG: histone deacetylase [Chloroflexota bacterium]